MSQSEFPSLAASVVPNNIADEILSTDVVEVDCISDFKENAVLTLAKCKDDTIGELYVPVNFIPVEVYGFIAAWDSANSTTTSQSDGMELDVASVPSLQTMFEPARCLSELGPPKRFYRTFWRSAARRILALTSKGSLKADAESST